MTSKKVWKIAKGNEDAEKNLIKDLGVSSCMARLLVNRGILDAQKASEFLYPKLEGLHDPYLLEDMKKAVDRIELAITNGEPILIYGDYDVDGITSVSLLITYIRYLGGRVAYHIPRRLDEGYGLNSDAIMKANDKGFKLIVTVDCGINAHDEVLLAKNLGIDVIITDHHEPSDKIPECIAVVNPKLRNSKYPCQFLAGVGVAFKLCQALWINRGRPSGALEPLNYIELVAFGTVADVVPLLGENRIIVKYGIERMNRTTNPGIRALIDVSGKSGKQITSGTISFIFAPKVNVCGRLGDPGLGVKLLLSRDVNEVYQIANKLNEENQRRQQIEAEILKEGIKMLKDMDYKSKKGIVLSSASWHTGVIGIAASKIVELTNRPTFLISIDSDGIGKGSGRSVAGFDLYSALSECSDMLIKYGGHSQAAGISISSNDIESFQRKFDEIAASYLSEEDLIGKVNIDYMLYPGEISMDLLNEIKALEPYGLANPHPVFASRGLTVVDCRSVGVDGGHLKMKLGYRDKIYEAIGFRMGQKQSYFTTKSIDNGSIDVVYSLEENSWGNIVVPELNIKDIREFGE